MLVWPRSLISPRRAETETETRRRAALAPSSASARSPPPLARRRRLRRRVGGGATRRASRSSSRASRPEARAPGRGRLLGTASKESRQSRVARSTSDEAARARKRSSSCHHHRLVPHAQRGARVWRRSRPRRFRAYCSAFSLRSRPSSGTSLTPGAVVAPCLSGSGGRFFASFSSR